MTLQKIFWIIFYSFCFTIPISQFLSVRLLIIALVVSFFVPSFRLSTATFRNSWDLILYLLVIISGLFYSEDLGNGFKVIETSFSFLALSIIIGRASNFEGYEFKNILHSFCLGLILACLICLLNASLEFRSTGNFNSFYFYELTSIINFQPTYFAYYLIFGITYYLYLLHYSEIKYPIGIGVPLILFFFVILLLTGGQTSFVSLLLVFSFFILKYLVEEGNQIKRITITVILLMLGCMFLISFMEENQRTPILNDSWERIVLWESTFRAVPNIFLGVGTGDYKIVLNNYYLSHDLKKFANEGLNSHNQVIQLLFSNGFLGVIAFILMIGRPLYMATQAQNMLAVLTFFPFIIYSVTEVFLGRYQGVVFFSLLHQVFMRMIQTQVRSHYYRISNLNKP